MELRIVLVTLCLVTTGLITVVDGDRLQLHRALPSTNGKPGHRVSTSASYHEKSGKDKHPTMQIDKKTDVDARHNTMDFDSEWSEAAFYSIISTILVGLSGIFPLLVIPLEAGPSLKHGAGSAMLRLLLSFAVGSLLGDVFLHLLPEAWASVNSANSHNAHTRIGLFVIAGMLSFLIIEKIFGEEEEDEEEDQDEEEQTDEPVTESTEKIINENGYNLRSRAVTNGHTANGTKVNVVSNDHANGHTNGHVNGLANGHFNGHANGTNKPENNLKTKHNENRIKVTGYLNLLANIIDNFTHGLAVAGSYLVSPKVGFCTTVAILLHEVPHEIGDFAVLLRSGFNRWNAAKAQVLTASGGVLGAITALTAESAASAGDRTAWILPFTAGGFIYIALVTVVPDLLKEKSPIESLKQMFCLILGVFTMLIVTIIFE